MIFGSTRDAATLLHIRRELVSDVIEQEILYLKIDVQNTVPNIYGESESKLFYVPTRMVCLIKRGEQTWKSEDYGPDMSRNTSFAFTKEDFVDAGFRPDVGDIIIWHGNPYEIDGTNENQYFLGKDEHYRLGLEDLGRYGESVSIVCSTHNTRTSRFEIGETTDEPESLEQYLEVQGWQLVEDRNRRCIVRICQQ